MYLHRRLAGAEILLLLPKYVFSPSRRWSSRFSVPSQIVRRRNKLKLELQRSSGHPLNSYLPKGGWGEQVPRVSWVLKRGVSNAAKAPVPPGVFLQRVEQLLLAKIRP